MSRDSSQMQEAAAYRCESGVLSATARCFRCFTSHAVRGLIPPCGAPATPCANCGAVANVPVMYGPPAVGLRNTPGAPDVILGGWLIGQDDPEWRCRACGYSLVLHEWRPQ